MRLLADRKKTFSAAVLFLVLTMLLSGCGKKGPLTLKSYQKPPAPARLSAIHREDAILLSWSSKQEKLETITGFAVMRKDASGAEKVYHVPLQDQSFADRDFSIGEHYVYSVLAESGKAVMSTSSPPLTVVPLQPPQRPEGVAVEVTGNSVVITWKGEGQRYNVYRRHDGESYGLVPINPGPLKDSRFIDAIDIRRTVHYAVRGLLDTEIRDEGPLSDEVTVDPAALLPPAPRNLRWFAASDRVVLTWDESEESWITGYRVYRRDEGQPFVFKGETQIPSFIDEDRPATKRDYRVRAVGPRNEGAAAEVDGIP